jgi:hypothetical protein
LYNTRIFLQYASFYVFESHWNDWGLVHILDILRASLQCWVLLCFWKELERVKVLSHFAHL